MVGWSVGIEQLLSYGVPLTQDHLDLFRTGGQVLSLGHLPHPDSYINGWEEPMLYPTGGPVLLPEVYTVYPEDAQYSMHFRSGPVSMAKALDDYHGKEWRQWASYIGDLVLDYQISPYTMDDIRPIRVWQCIPTVDEKSLLEIRTAAENMINDSQYEIIERLCALYAGDDWYWEESFHEIPNEILVEKDSVKFANFLEQNDISPDGRSELAVIRDGCLQLADLGFMDDDGAWSGYLPLRPLSEYLSTNEAKDLWATLLAQVETSEYLIRDALAGPMLSYFDYQERVAT